MARYRGPRQKIARRFKEPIFGPSKALERKPQPPGQHGSGRRSNESEYAVQHKEEQKAKYLPPIANGEAIAAFALTEPGSGSDVIGMKTTATLEGDEWVINGEKKFISQAGDASTYVVFAKTDPEAGSRGLSAFIVERGTPGFDDSKRMDLMAAHPIGEPRFENCRIPYTNLIGEPGQGLRLALGTLDTFRTTVAAAAVGMGQAGYEAALD